MSLPSQAIVLSQINGLTIYYVPTASSISESVNGNLYDFTGYDYQVYATDGTSALLLADAQSGSPFGGIGGVSNLAQFGTFDLFTVTTVSVSSENVGGILNYFTEYDYKIYATNGTSTPLLVADAQSGSPEGGGIGGVSNLAELGTFDLFTVTTASLVSRIVGGITYYSTGYDVKVYSTDGTSTQLLADAQSVAVLASWNNTVIFETTSDGTVTVYDDTGGTVTQLNPDTPLISNTYEVTSGQSLSGAIVLRGGDLILAGGTAIDTTITSAGVQNVESGGKASGTEVVSGGIENVSSGGKDFDATVNNGGFLGVYNDGVAIGATIESGGLLTVSSGGVASNTLALFDGKFIVSSGGTAVGTQLYASGPSGNFDENVNSGGQTFDETIYSGGLEDVRAGAISYNLTISSGGIQELGNGRTAAGGTAHNTTVSSGGTLVVYFGGVASNTLALSDGKFIVSSGGTAVGTQLYASGPSGNFDENVNSGGQTFDETIYSGGLEDVRSGATSYNLTISSGGIQELGNGTTAAGGTAQNTLVLAGGALLVKSGGVASGTTVASGGLETVRAGGFDQGAQISGGEQDVYGSATGVIVFTGSQVVEAGGTATSTTISGGSEYVHSGGTAVGVNFGGTGGLLKLDEASGLNGKISDLAIGDTIDFVSASVTSAVISGTTLTVTEAGGQSFSYQLAGQQPRSAPVLQSDGNNGTDVVLGPMVAVSIDNTDVNLAHNAGTVTFAFTAAPASFTLADTSAVGGTLSNLTGSGTTYTATFTAAPNTDIANASVAVTAGSWQDAGGNAGAGGATPAFTVDTVTPSLTSIAASGPGITVGSGDVFTGNTVTLTAQFSAAVTLSTAGGTPFLQLNDGGTASYAGGSGTAALTFVYTVAVGQQTADLAVTGLSPNGGTIQDAAGNAAAFAPSAGVLGGTVQVNEPNTGLVQVTAGNALVINTALTNGKTGTLDADGGSITVTGNVTNAGTIRAENGGTVTIGGNLTGSGTTEVADIFSGSEIELQGKFNSAAMAFQNNAGDTGVLAYDHSAAFGSMLGTVAGFSSDGTHSDTLDLKDLNFASGVSWSYNQNKSATAPGGILTVKDHTGDTANINLLGQYLAAGLSASSASPAPALSGLFNLAADSSTGTLVTTSHHG